MDREKALELAEKSGFHIREYRRHGFLQDEIALNEGFHTDEIVDLIFLVHKEALNQAAEVCDDQLARWKQARDLEKGYAANQCAEAIRALTSDQSEDSGATRAESYSVTFHGQEFNVSSVGQTFTPKAADPLKTTKE